MSVSAEQLRQLVSKIERLEEEKTGVQDGLKAVYQDAKSQGFDVKVLKKVIKNRKIDRQKLEEEKELIEIYTDTLGG